MTPHPSPVEYELLPESDPTEIVFRGRRLPVDDPASAANVRKEAAEISAEHGTLLPVVLGAGSGAILDVLSDLKAGAVVVADAEGDLDREYAFRFRDRPGLDIFRISDGDPDSAWKELLELLERTGRTGFLPLASSTWLKVRPRYYSDLLRRMKKGAAGGETDIGRRGVSARTRILLLRFGYFLEREIMNALGGMDVETHDFSPADEGVEGGQAYAEALLERVRRIRPHYVLSVNSLGGDFAGPLNDLLRRMGARFVSWFVDSPELFLHGREAGAGADAVFFCCDPDFKEKLRPSGFKHLHHLPLAADGTRFNLHEPLRPAPAKLDVSFIGTTWVDKLAAVHRNFQLPAYVLKMYRQAARGFVESPDSTMAGFLCREYPEMWNQCLGDMDAEERKGVLHLLCWEANRVYRLECVRHILGFSPLIAGDRHWERVVDIKGTKTVLHPPIGYYTPDLLEFYRLARVNFNCSGMQMRRAVNQRIFDVPAAGGFLLTDRRDQLFQCFEPDTEVACWDSPDEIEDAIRRWIADEPHRFRIVDAARKRIRAEHTYRHRLETMFGILKGS